ncbi:MAG: hypothetical protein ABIG44_12530 [Planctomycetota bacterium]
MNIIAHGIDIVRCERIEHMWRDHAERHEREVWLAAYVVPETSTASLPR